MATYRQVSRIGSRRDTGRAQMQRRGTLRRNEGIMHLLVMGCSLARAADAYGLGKATVFNIREKMCRLAERDAEIAMQQLWAEALRAA